MASRRGSEDGPSRRRSGADPIIRGRGGPLREAIAESGEAVLTVALRPDVSTAVLQQRLEAPRGKQSLSNVLRKAAKLSPAAIGLLHEAAAASSQKLGALNPPALAAIGPLMTRLGRLVRRPG